MCKYCEREFNYILTNKCCGDCLRFLKTVNKIEKERWAFLGLEHSDIYHD